MGVLTVMFTFRTVPYRNYTANIGGLIDIMKVMSCFEKHFVGGLK